MTNLPDTNAPITEETMVEAMTSIMNGESDHNDLKRFLVDMSAREITADEITGAAKVMRAKASGIEAPHNAVDCCGTGGDASGTYNISTAVAIVAASCGVPIAKHGNRAASSKSGAADVLEALGINLDVSKPKLEEALKLFNFCFLMAPKHHTAMKHVMPARKEIGKRTIFNLLGPLANPAGTRLQLIGVYDQALLEPMAETLRNLGTKRAWVVHGSDGLDEITTTASSEIAVLDEGIITRKTLTPDDFGLQTASPQSLKGGEADQNANALRALLEGQKCAYRDIVLANTAAVLNIHGKAETLQDGVARAAEEIDSGHSYQLLKDYIQFTREAMDEDDNTNEGAENE